MATDHTTTNSAIGGGVGDETLIADHGGSTLTGGAENDLFEGVLSVRYSDFYRIDGTEDAIVIHAGDGNDAVQTSNSTVDTGVGENSVYMYGT